MKSNVINNDNMIIDIKLVKTISIDFLQLLT